MSKYKVLMSKQTFTKFKEDGTAVVVEVDAPQSVTYGADDGRASFKTGDVVEMDEKDAASLVATGVLEKVLPGLPPPTPPSNPTPKPTGTLVR